MDPFGGLVDDISFSEIHFIDIITPTTKASYFSLSIPINIPSITLSKVTVPFAAVNKQLVVPIQLTAS